MKFSTNGFQNKTKVKSSKLSINEMAKMMKDISVASYNSSKMGGGSGLISFDL